MEFLIEAFPFAFGVLLGLSCERLGGWRRHRLLWAGASVPLGAFATLASGEWRESLAYFAFDIAVVASVALGTSLALGWRQRRTARR